MLTIKDLKIFFLLLGFISNFSLVPSKVLAGSFGAEIFCTMREAGNDHESSWEAAYNYIKRQKGGFFKTSPQQAATQLVETVVREKDKFSNCVEYLDKLYPDRELQKKLLHLASFSLHQNILLLCSSDVLMYEYLFVSRNPRAGVYF